MAHDSAVIRSANQLAATRLIEACVAQGVDHFFLAPGSRCTPLTLAVANRPDVTVIQHFDERGLAYACVGYGRATRRPGALVCTSGTAVANLLPAVVEAAMDHVPLLLLTADRPPELRDVGANQAIDQVKLFGDFAEWFVDLPCPAEDLPTEYWAANIRFAVARSRRTGAHQLYVPRAVRCT